ncbi:MAG: hypothetical protein AAB362_00655 [Patescibacteria group bacterium]
MERKLIFLKKYLYISLFAILGVLCASLIHGIVEILYIQLLLADFGRYGLGLSWGVWIYIHNILAIGLWVLGLVLGFYFGRYWWQVMYVRHDYIWRKERRRWLAKYFD